MVTTVRTEWLRFGGMNVRGTPPMPREKVVQDLRQFRRHYDNGVLCEFKWKAYWDAAEQVLRQTMGAFPSYAYGKKFPVLSGQPCFWDRKAFTRIKGKRTLSHAGFAGISELRLFRAVRIRHDETDIDQWNVSGHFVVGGDEESDGPIRKDLLRKNIDRFVRFLRKLKRTGVAILGQIDANIHRGTWAYRHFMRKMKAIGAQFVGEHGVEYAFFIHGTDVQVKVRKPFDLLPKHRGGVLNTDHETRGFEYRLIRQVA